MTAEQPTNGAAEFPRWQPADADAPWEPSVDEIADLIEQGEHGFPDPEDRGTATLSALGEVAYTDDLLRPGRIVVWAGEEGSGKSYTVSGELAIRTAVAGGTFAVWPVLRTGPVLVLSEMHSDDDHGREETVLASLGLERAALGGRLYRLSLMTAAGMTPALDDAAWRPWIVEWMRERGVLLLVIDTATSATTIDPWGEEIRALFRRLRLMLADYPELAIILTVHLKKPTGRGERRISDVIGEWGRWADVLVLQENVGASLTQARLTLRKRVRTERRIVATKAGGLLVDATDADMPSGPRVPLEDVVAAIVERPGVTAAQLGSRIGVTKRTAQTYAEAAEAEGLIERRRGGPRGSIALYPVEVTGKAGNTGKQGAFPVLAQSSPSDWESGKPRMGKRGSRLPLRSGDIPQQSEEELLQAIVDVTGGELLPEVPSCLAHLSRGDGVRGEPARSESRSDPPPSAIPYDGRGSSHERVASGGGPGRGEGHAREVIPAPHDLRPAIREKHS